MEPALHEHTRAQVAALLSQPHGSYVFYGPTGIGRAATTLWLLRKWHGHDVPKSDCSICHQISSRTLPDMIELTSGDASIGINAIHELQQQLTLSRPEHIGQRLVVIDEAKNLTIEAQNALLKLLEEPPSETIIIVLANHPRQLLETVRSRVKAVNFIALPNEQIQAALKNRGLSDDQANKLAHLADGRIGLSFRLADDQALRETYEQTGALINRICAAGLFERLVIAGQMGDSKGIDTEVFTALLSQRLRLQLRQEATSGHAQAAQGLLALERFTNHLDANVGLKPALSGLVMQL